MFRMPELCLQTSIKAGMEYLKNNELIFKNIFETMKEEKIASFYGEQYINDIWKWFNEVTIPVVQAFTFDSDRIPCYSIHLASESEDESKAAIGDFLGQGEDFNVGVAVMSVTIDIGIHAKRSKDEVLWLYYVLSYILFREKPRLNELGILLQTFSASDYNKDAKYMGENIFTRWVRFKCTTENHFNQEEYREVCDLDVDLKYSSNVINRPIVTEEDLDGDDII